MEDPRHHRAIAAQEDPYHRPRPTRRPRARDVNEVAQMLVPGREQNLRRPFVESLIQPPHVGLIGPAILMRAAVKPSLELDDSLREIFSRLRQAAAQQIEQHPQYPKADHRPKKYSIERAARHMRIQYPRAQGDHDE